MEEDGEIYLAKTEADISYKSTVEYYEKYGEYYLTLTDPEEIRECLPYLIARSYYSEFGPFPMIEGDCQVNITFAYGEGEKQYEDMKWFYFLDGQIPEFLKNKMKANLDE